MFFGKKYNNAGFTLIELMVAIVISSWLALAALYAAQTWVASSDMRNLNNEYKYVKLFFDDITVPKYLVTPSSNIEEQEYNWENNWYLKKATVSYEIPYIDIHKAIDNNWEAKFSISKKILDFSLKDNNNKSSWAYSYTWSSEETLSTLRNVVWGVILIKSSTYNYENIIVENKINSLWNTDIELRGRDDWKVVFSHKYDYESWLRKTSSENADYEINPSPGNKLLPGKLRIWFTETRDTIIPSGSTPGDTIDDKNYKLLKLKTLGTWKDCIIETPKWSSVFSWSVLKSIIKLDVYWKSFNFDTDHWTSKTDSCDYDLIYPIITRN